METIKYILLLENYTLSELKSFLNLFLVQRSTAKKNLKCVVFLVGNLCERDSTTLRVFLENKFPSWGKEALHAC